jgi:hypothetical protein
LNSVNAATRALLDIAASHLAVGGTVIIDRPPTAYLKLTITRPDENFFVTAHYVTSLVDCRRPSPEVTWWRMPNGVWAPVHRISIYGEVTSLLDDLPDSASHDAVQAELIDFGNVWLGENVATQQGGLDAIAGRLAATGADASNTNLSTGDSVCSS